LQCLGHRHKESFGLLVDDAESCGGFLWRYAARSGLWVLDSAQFGSINDAGAYKDVAEWMS
jgi:hypothetical protein